MQFKNVGFFLLVYAIYSTRKKRTKKDINTKKEKEKKKERK